MVPLFKGVIFGAISLIEYGYLSERGIVSLPKSEFGDAFSPLDGETFHFSPIHSDVEKILT